MVDQKGGTRSASYRQLNDLKVYLAAALLIITVVLFAWVVTGGFLSGVRQFLIAILPGFATALVAYLVIEFFLARRGMGGSQLLRDELSDAVRDAIEHSVRGPAIGVTNVYADMGSVPWARLFSTAQDVVIVARFFDGPLIDLDAELPAFFRRGGRLRMLMPNPANATLVAAMNHQRGVTAANRKMGIDQRIQIGANQLVRARAAAAGAGALEFYLCDELLNYSAVCLDERILLFAPCEQVFAAEFRAPRFELDLATASPAFRRFWTHEVAELLTAARRVNDLPDLKATAVPDPGGTS